MKMSAEQGREGYNEFMALGKDRHKIRVLFNDSFVENECLSFDTDKGEIELSVKDEEGKVLIDYEQDRIKTEIKTGRIIVFLHDKVIAETKPVIAEDHNE